MSDCLSRNEILVFLADVNNVDREMRDHVGRCPRCRDYAANIVAVCRYADVWDTFRSSPNSAIPSAVTDRIFDEVQPTFDQVRRQHDPCPAEETLLGMVLAPQSVSEDVRRHVENCELCQQATVDNWRAFEKTLDYQDLPKEEKEIVPPDTQERIFAAANKLFVERVVEEKQCPRRFELLSMLAGGEGSGEIRQHLSECSCCRQFQARATGVFLLAAAVDSFHNGVVERTSTATLSRIFHALQPNFTANVTQRGPCPTREQLLSHLWEADESAGVGAHLAECGHCQQQDSELREMLRTASRLENFQTDYDGHDREMPAEVTERLLSDATHDFRQAFALPSPEPLASESNRSDASNLVARSGTTNHGGKVSLLRRLVPFASAACLLIAGGIFIFLGQESPAIAGKPSPIVQVLQQLSGTLSDVDAEAIAATLPRIPVEQISQQASDSFALAVSRLAMSDLDSDQLLKEYQVNGLQGARDWLDSPHHRISLTDKEKIMIVLKGHSDSRNFLRALQRRDFATAEQIIDESDIDESEKPSLRGTLAAVQLESGRSIARQWQVQKIVDKMLAQLNKTFGDDWEQQQHQVME